MRYLYSIVLSISLAILMSGCFSITRVEKDLYTITQVDTTLRRTANNPPGDRDNGTIYPSPSGVQIERTYMQRDSTVSRYYPAFLRMGGIEMASFLAPGSSTKGSGVGLFGLYDIFSEKRASDTKTFGANMYRLMPYEVRLRWLGDDPDWTIGTSVIELFTRQKDSAIELSPGEYLVGTAPLYLRKRIFLRSQIPYVMVVPFLGLSIVPSQYVNLGASIDVGSYGGFNIRGYAGYVFGSWLLPHDDPRDFSLAYPYFGIGVSALDFVNRTEELFIEWKDHKHSALEVSGLNVDLVRSLSSGVQQIGSRSDSGGTSAFSGLIVRAASATYPLPFGERRLFVGTSLLNIIALSRDEVGFGFLPIRAGYRFNLMSDELNLEPFAELTYYPVTMYHLGARLSVPLYDWGRVNVVAGFASGSPNNDVALGLENLGVSSSWSAGYVGIGIGIGDVFHTPQEVMRK